MKIPLTHLMHTYYRHVPRYLLVRLDLQDNAIVIQAVAMSQALSLGRSSRIFVAKSTP